MSKSEIKNNLLALRAAVEAQPETNFNLSVFKEEDEGGCGTLFCTVGLACTMPMFQEKGYQFVGYGSSLYAERDGEDVMYGATTDPEFGENSFSRLFSTRENGYWDNEYPSATVHTDDWGFTHVQLGDVTDKELALWRLDKQIAEYSV